MSNKLTLEAFIANARAVYGDAYDYSKVVYVGNKQKVEVVCPAHGSFWVTPNNHMRGKSGCPTCKGESVARRNKKPIAHFEARMRLIHGDKYSYDWETMTHSRKPMRIECREHGWFVQSPHSHASGRGCPDCWEAKRRHARMLGADTIASRVTTLKPGVRLVKVPERTADHITYICPDCGSSIKQKTNDVINTGIGCPVCSHRVTKPVLYLQKFIEAHGFETVLEYSPDWLGRKSLDLYVPEANFAIEFNGAWCHHSSPNSTSAVAKFARKRNNHQEKWKLCKQNGVSLLQVWDFKWDDRRHVYLHKILHRLNLDTVIYARKCTVHETDKAAVAPIYKQWSMEGGMVLPNTAKHYALRYNGTDVMWMTVGEKVREWGRQTEVLRMHTLPGVTVVGGVSKLLKLCPPGTVMFTTNDTGSVYPGGEQTSLRYWWHNPDSKLTITRAAASPSRREALNGDVHREGESETQFMERHGWIKVWDSGLTKYVL